MPSKAAELRELSDDQLLERAESAREELFNLRFQLATGQLDDASTIKKTRHEIARIATVLRERDLDSAAASAIEAQAAVASADRGATDQEER
jgi:large subunit ribosomal protein L29